MFVAALSTITNLRTQPKCPSTGKWTEAVVHTYNGILLNHENNEMMPPAATWMDLEVIVVSGVSQRNTSII